MYVNYQRTSEKEVQEFRRNGGEWLRDLRQKRNLSQRQLAQKVSVDYYTFISQLENGRGRIPPDRYQDWADALGVPVSSFVFNIMRFYDPVTFELLFGKNGELANEPNRFEMLD